MSALSFIDRGLLVETMLASTMFRESREETIKQLADVTRLRTYKAGDTLFWENDPNGTVYLVCTGEIAIERYSDDGKAVAITTRLPGEVIGEVSLFEDVPRTADARATGESRVAIIEGDRLVDLIKADGGLAMGVIRVLAQKLHESIERKVVQTWKLPRRLAALLIELAKQGSTKVEGKGLVIAATLTQEEMAVRIECTREHINRALRQFREDGLIETEGRTIVLRKPKSLKAIANGPD